jgi:hypothetical protein
MSVTKIKSRFSLRRLAAILGLGILITIKLTGVLSAQTVTRGYGSDQVLQRGMIVAVERSEPEKVESIDVTRVQDILGVVVNPNDSPITISDDNQHIFVATSGRYDVLVSDQQGAIKASDYITVSSLAGVGMKADENQSNILGRAVSDFDGKSGVLSTVALTGGDGKQKTVHLARIQVEIAVAKNPLSRVSDNTPLFLGAAARAIAGKTVSPIRLYLSAAIFLVGIITAGAILYAGVRSSIIAIGRNPLSRRSIFRSLAGVTLTSFVVFLISAIGVYLLLKV